MTPTSAAPDQAARRHANPLRGRDFRLLWAGQAISSLGDQFALVALPWLALLLTGSSLALGGVLALMAIPRAALMLVGGVYVDRLSPRRVMILSDVVRLITVALLAFAILAGVIDLPILYLFALVFGMADAFFYPAQQAIIPALVDPEGIAAANALSQGTTQLTFFLGPGLAGVLIAALGTTATHLSLLGVGAALLVDALSFVASVGSLVLIHGGSARPVDPEPIVAALKTGMRFVWGWPTMRFVVLFVLGINLLIVGPLDVGLPMIAYARLPTGAAGYGSLMSAMGGGALVGMVVVALGLRPKAALLGPIVLSVLAWMGIGLAALAFVSFTPLALALTALVGFAMGYGNLTFITWAQQRIPQALMGRVSSLILMASVTAIPVSQAISGAVVSLSLSGTLAAAGLAMALITFGAALSPAIRRMGLEPIPDREAAA